MDLDWLRLQANFFFCVIQPCALLCHFQKFIHLYIYCLFFSFSANELKEVANDIIFGNSLKGKSTVIIFVRHFVESDSSWLNFGQDNTLKWKITIHGYIVCSLAIETNLNKSKLGNFSFPFWIQKPVLLKKLWRSLCRQKVWILSYIFSSWKFFKALRIFDIFAVNNDLKGLNW